MDKIKLHKFLKQKAGIAIKCLPEDMPIKGSFDSGDDALDLETENKIYADLESGNQWAWCVVKVRATWRGFSGDTYLGACSYSSIEEFLKGDYYSDMVDDAVNALVDDIILAQKGITELEKKLLDFSM